MRIRTQIFTIIGIRIYVGQFYADPDPLHINKNLFFMPKFFFSLKMNFFGPGKKSYRISCRIERECTSVHLKLLRLHKRKMC